MRDNDKTGNRRPWWFAVLGGAILVLYGFVPTFQPTSNFGRVYAAYGGAFIVMSFLFGWVLDGNRPDIGDVVGGVICLVGASVVYFWPRTE
jgi:small multidrug resistance family-3 protein